MKSITKQQLELIAHVYECELSFEPLPTLSFGDNGFEATEEYEGTYSGFRFFGDPKKQSDYIRVWNALTDPVVNKPALTIELAKKLIGKIVRVSYNEGEYTLRIEGITSRKSNSIGQTTENILLFREFIDGEFEKEQSNWIYEWQDIFRRGSGAERLFIEEIW